MNEELLPIEAVQERDIDLILLEEFNTNNAFAEWFVNECNAPKLTENIGAWKSISDFGLGETDILFKYKSSEKEYILLIENKLDAQFQENQYERYLKRAENYLKQNKCNECFCILIAPEFYCNNQNDFENYVSYETLSKRFEFLGTKRDLFKSKLLKIASEKLRRGYKPINSEPVQKFWLSYFNLKNELYPDLKMKKPNIIAYNSDWPEMRDESVPNVIFYNKLSKGFVDATFCNFSSEKEFEIKNLIPNDAKYVKHSKRFSVRVLVDIIDRTKDFNEQKEKIVFALNRVDYLRNWIKDHKDNILQD
jgi:hypothetical protein